MITENADVSAKLKAIPAFKDIDQRTLKLLSEGVFYVRLPSGKTLFRFNDDAESCFIVSYGAIKLWRTSPQKKEMAMCYCQPGDFIGAAILSHPRPKYPVGAVALEDSGLIQIPRKIYLDVWRHVPTVIERVNSQVMARMLEFHEDKTLAGSPVPLKIARFLLRTLEAQPEGFGDRLNLKLTRRDVAERVGTTVETAIRTMSGWSKLGWINIEDHHIEILNKPALEALLSE